MHDIGWDLRLDPTIMENPETMSRARRNYGQCFEEIRILWKCFGNAYGYAFDTNAMNDLFDVLSASLEA